MDYLVSLKLLEPGQPELAAELRPLAGLGSVLHWLGQRGLALGAVEIIAQDEFSLDFIVPLTATGPFVVFGIN